MRKTLKVSELISEIDNMMQIALYQVQTAENYTEEQKYVGQYNGYRNVLKMIKKMGGGY